MATRYKIISAKDVDTDGTLAANSDTKIASQKAVKTYADNISYGMARQAIMNGNFDVWQRGTNMNITVDGSFFLTDRWVEVFAKDGGTYPTITCTQQLLTSGDIAGAKYFHRLATNGAGSSFGVNSYGLITQRIENGTSKLCGLNKKVTVSFFARSSITNKRITPTLTQIYGTGGSPSAAEPILGTPITLTSTWTKYTATFTTNTLVGKTFGTAGDDYLALNLWNQWGTTIGNAQVQSSVTAESYVGAGNIDIAQVQLCSGDVALPFQPKSFEEELRACQRYYERPYFIGAAFPSDGQTALQRAVNYSSGTTSICLTVQYKVEKRIAPNGVGKVRYDINDGAATTGNMANSTTGIFWFGSGLNISAGQYVDLHDWEADAEL